MTGILNLPGVEELGTKERDEFYVIRAKSSRPIGRACKLSCKLRKNGTKVLRINDVPHHGKATVIRYHTQRFACRDCVNDKGEVVGSGGIYEKLIFLQDGFRITRRLLLWIARQSMRRTFASVARDAAIDPKTAAKAFNAYVDVEIKKLKRQTPRVLGIDEKKLLGDYRAVLGNIEERTVLDMLVDREKTLERKLYELAEDRRVEVVVTDRYEAYRTMVARTMKGRLHVTDRFHVTAKANDLLDKLRGSIAKGLTDRRQGAQLRMAKSLFRTRWHDADDVQKAAIERWGGQIPILHDAYWAKEHYCDMYLCDTPAEAENYYHAWRRDLPESVGDRFRAACDIPKRWMPMVLAYFEEPYTTGYVESVNRFLDDLQRDGRGYSFEVIRAKLMLAEKLEKRTFRGKRRLDALEKGLPSGIGSSINLGVDLDEMNSLFDPPQIIEYNGREITIDHGISTCWPAFAAAYGDD